MPARRVSSDLPFRLDRLPMARWHWMVILGLGITWVLDGLEVTIVGNLGPTLETAHGLRLTDTQFTSSAGLYLAGAACGALVFGFLTDRFGRKKLFLVTLGWYIALTVATAFSWNYASFAVFRALTGFGLGGEYAAVNSAIDELIPSRRRGAVDLGINATWWLGTIVGSLGTLVLLDPRLVDPRLGWRLAFGLGAVLAVGVVFVRTSVPESPRWLLTHGRPDEAERIVEQIETRVAAQTGRELEPAGERRITIDTAHRTGLGTVLRLMAGPYRQRTLVALTLMCTQAFIYNAFTFTQGLVLTTFFAVPATAVATFTLPFAIGNLAGPLVLGRLFDSVGRKTMVAATYAGSGVLLAITGLLFARGALDAVTITACWAVVFFFASAGASAAYLTASEVFPLEARALAIAVIYAGGTLAGGAIAPSFFGALIASKDAGHVVGGYFATAAIMIAGAVVQARFGVAAENRSLEDIAAPLSSAADAVPPAARTARA